MPAAAAGRGNLNFHINIVTSCQHAHTIMHQTVRKLSFLPCLQQPCMRGPHHEQLQFVYNICAATYAQWHPTDWVVPEVYAQWHPTNWLSQKSMHNGIQ